ncbi:MAG: O-antigen ligase family protein [Gammaproteobacteria bacterium]|nr:O-antigen ligase family protein [Gammaproteobacteria bacterium]MBU1732193.1 O-antigen ligase family protein [Gammaproteobacteria bacterium]MBU1893277.1 O-antigen ligase family protein [Gammaproteobacteria bacterium]
MAFTNQQMTQTFPPAQNTGDAEVPDERRWLMAPAAIFLLVLPFNHTMALRLLSLCAAFAVAIWYLRKYPVPRMTIKWPLLAWIGLAVLSVAWSHDPAFSLGEIKAEIGYGMFAFSTFFILTRSETSWRLWLNLIVLSLALTLAVSLYRYWAAYPGGYEWDDVHGYVSYSTYLATVTPFLLIWIKNLKGHSRWLGGLMLAVFLWVAYLNTNRMFWISFFAVLVVISGFMGYRKETGRAKVRALAVLVVAMLVSGIFFIQVAKHRPPDAAVTSSTGFSGSHLINTFAQSERYRIWQYWVEKIAERPLTGVGFGRDLPRLVYQKPTEWPDLFFAHAHNLVLNHGLQMGIPGILVLLLLFGSMTRAFWRMAQSSDRKYREIGIVGLGLIVAVFTKNMTDDLFWRTDALIFWAFAGILFGYGARLGRSSVR